MSHLLARNKTPTLPFCMAMLCQILDNVVNMATKGKSGAREMPMCTYCKDPVPSSDLVVGGIPSRRTKSYFHGSKGCGPSYVMETCDPMVFYAAKGTVMEPRVIRMRSGLAMRKVAEIRN